MSVHMSLRWWSLCIRIVNIYIYGYVMLILKFHQVMCTGTIFCDVYIYIHESRSSCEYCNCVKCIEYTQEEYSLHVSLAFRPESSSYYLYILYEDYRDTESSLQIPQLYPSENMYICRKLKYHYQEMPTLLLSPCFLWHVLIIISY